MTTNRLSSVMITTFFSASLFTAVLNSAENNTSSTQDVAAVKNQIVKAKAIINPTKGNKVKGIVTFSEGKGGLKIVADLEGLKPGKHGFHVHEFGDCSALDGSSTGDHFNPTDKKHSSPDDKERHIGDLGNIVADSQGKSHFERLDTIMSLNGPNSIVNRSIVVHEGEDDLKSQPSGNSGAKIGCGVIKALDSQ